MQWLIDIIKEWVEAKGYLTASFVDRGDTVMPEFLSPFFTKDGAWHDMDMSYWLPENTKAVHLTVFTKGTVVNKRVVFRKNGNVNTANAANFYTQVANIYLTGDCIVAVGADRIVEYVADPTISYVSVTIRGWAL